MVILVQVESQNFETFIGNHVVKKLEKFIVVTGPNGAGKSNIMDVVAFAMGAKSDYLRVSRVEELVHTSAPRPQGMFVRVILRMDDGSERRFKRCVLGCNCRCYINNNVSYAEILRMCTDRRTGVYL